jgi:isopentenyl-diphosphate delta-isomerase
MTSSRKDQHLDLCIDAEVGFRDKGTLLDDVELVHDALPDLSLDEIDLSVELFGKRLRAPVVIAAMTGGAPRAEAINRDLARLAEALGIGLGLGSQRGLLERGAREGFFLRDIAPGALLLGNLGVLQARGRPIEDLRALVDACGLDALALHLNPAMECIQPEGDKDFRGGLETIERLVRELDRPLFVKETGAGLSRAVVRRLVAVGVRVVDISGAGGTSWTGVETLRASGERRRLGETFWDWGIPTAASVAQVADLGVDVVATGGVDDGRKAALLLALGARAVGVARPLLRAHAAGGLDGARAFLERMIEGIRLTMLLAGARDLQALRSVPLVLGPRLLAWIPANSALRARRLHLAGNEP